MSKHPTTKRKKEISPAVMEMLRLRDLNPPTVAQPFPPLTAEQIDLLMKMSDAEHLEYIRIFKVARKADRRQARLEARSNVVLQSHKRRA